MDREQPVNLEREHQIAELAKKLEAHGIDVLSWGREKAKTIENLFTEIEAGETQLVQDPDGGLFREVIVAKADVYATDPNGVTRRLIEKEQIFSDGRKRERNLDTAISEKLKVGENPDESIVRGIEEELGITGDVVVDSVGIREQLEDSPSYPGLQTRYRLHYYRVTLTADQYRPEGYTETQLDKKTIFIWESAKPASGSGLPAGGRRSS